MCRKTILLASFIVLFTLISSAFATERHVYPCDFRLTTIDAAYNAASAGDTIIVHACEDGGTYHFNIDASLTKADDSKHDITFRAYEKDHIVIDNGLHFAYKSGITIDGLVIQSPTYGIVVYSRSGWMSDDFTIKNTIITNCGNNAFYHYGSSDAHADNWTWENCTFYNLTGHDGIRAKKYNYNWTIKDCIFQSIKHWDDSATDWAGYAMSCDSGGMMYADYCTFYDNGYNCDGSENGYSASDQALYGSEVTTDIEVQFACTNIENPRFLYLQVTNDSSILTGDSDGSYRGARPTPEPATIALLGLGGMLLLKRRCKK